MTRPRFSHTSFRRITSLFIIFALLSTPIRAAMVRFTTETTFTPTSNAEQSDLFGLQALFSQMQRGDQDRGMPSLPEAASERSIQKKPLNKAEREAKVATLELNYPDKSELISGERALFMAIPVDENDNAIHGLVAEWESDSPEVLAIEKNGEALAKKAGTATITATAGSKKATVKISVIEKVAGSTTTRAPARQRFLRGMRSHPDRLLASMLPQNQVPESEYRESLFKPYNMIGDPPGKTTPGASVPPAAISGTEMPGSSNFNFDIPVVDLAGRGLGVNLSLIYNSRMWSKSTTSTGATRMTYNIEKWQPVAPGFLLNFGQIREQGNTITYIDPDATHHELIADPAGGYITNDGTFIRYDGGSVVTYPDGTQATFGADGLIGGTPPAAVQQPTKITDRNGNYILIDYLTGVYGYTSGPRRINTIQDSMGRYVRFYYDASKSLVAITMPGYQNGADRQVIRFYYQDVTITQPGLFQSGYTVNAPSTVRLLKYVYLPGSGEASDAKVGFRYDYSAYGMIYQVTQFRGMTVGTTALNQTGSVTSEGTQAARTTYNYPTAASSLSDAPTYTTRTDDWAGRVSAQPVYTFSVDQATGVSTVSAPDGTVSETHTIVNAGSWDNGLVNEMIVKQGSSVLSDTDITWEQGAQIGGINGNHRIQQIQTTNEASQTKVTVFSYDPSTIYNNVSVVSERDFAPAGSLGTELRRTETSYQTGTAYTGRGLVHLPTSVKVYAGGSNTTFSRTDYAYDETSLAPRSGIIMYTDPATTARGNLTTATGYAGAGGGTGPIPLTQAYDTAGNVTAASVDCCQQKSFTYSSSYYYAYPTSMTRGSGPTLASSVSYDFNTGLALNTTDENSQVTTLYYDNNSLRPFEIDFPDGGAAYPHYSNALTADAAGRLHYFVNITTRLDASHTVDSYQFSDGRGAVTQTFNSYTTANGWATQDIEYDVMERPYRASNPYYSGGYGATSINPSGLWTTKTFDKLGRVTQVTRPSGDSQSSTTSTAQLSYAGTVMTTTDAAGRQRRQVTDALGRVVRVDEPDSSGSLGTISTPIQPTAYAYDVLNNLIRITQGSQNRYFKYDSLSRLTHERQVEQDAPYNVSDSLTGNNLWSSKYIYNSNGLVTDAYDARQINTHFVYDGLNRVSQVSYSDTTPVVNYTYDQAHAGYYNNGRLTKVITGAVASPTTTQQFDYDRVGRVLAQTEKIGSTAYAIGYLYNLAGQLTRETYPSGRQMNYGFDEAGRLSSITDGLGVTYDNGFQYAAHGEIKSETFGNTAVRAVSYNNALQPSQIKLTLGGIEQQRYDYFYGQVNLSTGTVDTTKNTGQVGRIDGSIGGVKQWDQRFIYDSLGRLSQAGEYQQGQSSQLTYQAHYDYDRWGNRYQYQQNVNLGYAPVQTSDINTATNRFISTGATPVNHDPAGNIISDSKFRMMTYQYDANGRQKQSSNGAITETAVYDAVGQRVQTSASGNTRNLVYDVFGQDIAEYNNGILERENIYRGVELLASNEASGGLKYVLQDKQGATRAVMSGSSIATRHDYLPFGEEIASGTGLRTSGQGYGATDHVRQRYSMMERDDVSGLDHTDWRKYESYSGRWTSPDPYKGSMTIGNPQSFNRYTYVQNDPMNLIDPTGLMCYARFEVTTTYLGGGKIREVWTFLGTWCDDFGNGPATAFTHELGHDTFPTDLKGRVQTIANNCADFLNKFLAALGAKKVNASNIANVLDRLKPPKFGDPKLFAKYSGSSNAGMILGDQIYVFSDSVTENTAQNDPEFRWDKIAQTVLGELIHRADGHFSDSDVDKAAKKLMSPAEQLAAKSKMSDSKYAKGSIGYQMFKNNCPPPQRKKP